MQLLTGTWDGKDSFVIRWILLMKFIVAVVHSSASIWKWSRTSNVNMVCGILKLARKSFARRSSCTYWSNDLVQLHHQTEHLDLTIRFATHEPCAHFTYHLYLRPLYLLRKRRKFSPELRLKFVSSRLIVSLCFAFAPLLYLVLLTPFALLRHTEPSPRTTPHPLILHQKISSLLPDRTPRSHIGFTLRSQSTLIFVAS